MSTSKTEMKSKYETKFICAPVSKTEIKNAFSGYSRYTTVCYLNQQKQRESLYNLQKNKKITTLRILSVPKCTLLKRLCQFVATVNVYLDTPK